MKGKQKIANPAPGASWTRPDAYIGALAIKRSYRRAREGEPKSQSVPTRPWLSTVPFAAILTVLAILAVAIMFVAFPGNQPSPKPKQAAVREQGVAPRGWFQEAQKEMHR
ncbi:MAG: hypothetical protein ABI853_03520 [Sphingomicrobium sp.]